MENLNTHTCALIYARVSTDKQVTDGNGLESQTLACIKHCNAKGYRVIGEYKDGGVSGKLMQRDGLQAMFAFIAATKTPYVIVVQDITRLARDVQVGIELMGKAKEYNCRVESLNQKFEDTPMGSFMRTIYFGMGQFEREVNRERVVANMDTQLSLGRRMFGGPPSWYHYQKRVMLPYEPNATIARQVYERIVSGELPRTAKLITKFMAEKGFVSKKTKLPIKPSLHVGETLLREHIVMEAAGYLRYKGKWIEAQHKPIISKELARRVLDKLGNKDGKHRTGLSDQFVLRGFMKCAGCDHLMTAYSPNKNEKYGYYCCRQAGCPYKDKGTKFETVHQQFADLLKRACPGDKALEVTVKVLKVNWKARLTELNEDRQRWQRRIVAADTEIQGFLSDARTAPGESLKNVLYGEVERLTAEKQDLEHKLDTYRLNESDFEKILDSVYEFLRNPAKAWLEGDGGAKRMVQKLVFSEMLTYVPRENFRNPNYALPFSVFEESNREKSGMVDPNGIEPTT